MRQVSAKPRLLPVCFTLLSALIWGSSTFAQQAIEDNIRPVAQVCLAGQPCVGTTGTASGTVPAATPAAAAPVVATPVPAVVEVAAPAAVAAAFDAAATYQMSCFACHGTGAAGAPKLGDKEAWSARLEKGMDSVMVNVTNGINAMPAKGMCMTCTDENLRALVDYMVSQ
ncbi:MAG: cytochrome c5 family protein [Gammaproteobacteria bacterium]|nr:cytochrome c5 family protein [Gammaproteobacteria bacterium]